MAKELRELKSKAKATGPYAFLIGVVLVVLLGLVNSVLSDNLKNLAINVVIIAGILIGLFNITAKESKNFLFAALAMVLTAYAGNGVIQVVGSNSLLGTWLSDILGYLMILFVPTTIIVALRAVFEIARD